MPLSVSSATKQLSDGNSAGTQLGKSPTDLIGFYGAAPIAQPAGGIEVASPLNGPGALVATRRLRRRRAR